MTGPASMRARFLSAVLAQVGSPYGWGRKGEKIDSQQGLQLRRFDCSGLVTWAFREVGGPDWRAMFNTDRLLRECRAVLEPRPGTLALYGPRADDASHVMVYVGAGVVVGASGGDSSTVTLEDAVRQGARVKPFPVVEYRRDFIGYRELPFADE